MSDMVIGANTAAAEAALARILKGLEQVEKQTKRDTAAARDYNQELAKAVKVGAKSVSIPGVAGAGALGGAVGKVGEGLQAGGMLGKLAVASAALGIATGFVNRFAEVAQESARQRLEIEQKINDITKRGREEREKSALAGLSHEGGLRRALVLAGDNGLSVARALSDNGSGTIDQSATAVSNFAMAQGRGMTAEQSPHVRYLLSEIAKLGGDLGQAGTFLGMRGSGLAQMDAGEVIASFMRESTGMNVTRADVGRGLTRVDESTFLTEAQRHRAAGNQVGVAQMGLASTGILGAKDAADLARTKDPESAMRPELFNETQKQTELLSKMAQANGRLFEIWDNWTKPQGGFETQMIRLTNATSAAFTGSGER